MSRHIEQYSIILKLLGMGLIGNTEVFVFSIILALERTYVKGSYRLEKYLQFFIVYKMFSTFIVFINSGKCNGLRSFNSQLRVFSAMSGVSAMSSDSNLLRFKKA